MAEENRPPEPPKIKLGLNKVKPPTTPIPTPPPSATPGAPPKIKIQSAEKKADTARIDLSAAQPPTASVPPDELKQPTEDEMAEFYKKSTIRIDAPTAGAGSTQKVDESKRSTMRVDIPLAGGAQGTKEQTQIVSDAAKATTMRVEPARAESQRLGETSKRSTIRVDAGIEQKKKSETAKLELPASELTKRTTAKISITEASKTETDDVFKKRTIAVPVPPMPSAAPPKPTGIAPIRPKTVTLRPPGKPIADEPGQPLAPAIDTSVSEARKSETARLDLPPETAEERPATRPKTIRIKRPDGTTGRKALTITRPTEDTIITREARAELGGQSGFGEDQPGTGWAVAALAAVLVAAVLVYVLAAQTIAENLPWPGRLM